MQPIFPEYIQFLKDNGCAVDWFQENTFWLDNNIVKAFRRGGQVVSLFRISVDDQLTVTMKKHKQNKDYADFETWKETIERNRDRLKQLETDSITLLQQNCMNSGRKVINTNSTGKDSMVVTRLAQKAGLDFETYFNVTTLDVRESNRMAKRNDFKHILPDPKYGGFYKYIQRYDGGATK